MSELPWGRTPICWRRFWGQSRYVRRSSGVLGLVLVLVLVLGLGLGLGLGLPLALGLHSGLSVHGGAKPLPEMWPSLRGMGFLLQDEFAGTVPAANQSINQRLW